MAENQLLILGQKLAEKLKVFYSTKEAKTKTLLRRAKELKEKVDNFEETKKMLSDL